MKIAVLYGDGIGPEIVEAGIDILTLLNTKLKLGLTLDVYPSGIKAFEDYETTFPKATQEAVKEADGIILGPLSTYQYSELGKGGVNISATLRKELDLYANIRPCRSLENLPAPCPKMDIVIVRENTEGFYANRAMSSGDGEFSPNPEMAFALRKITSHCSRRIATKAFSLARSRQKHVTAIHKANVLKLTDSLFLKECRLVAEANKDIKYSEMLVDAAASHLVTNPNDFDILVTTNLFGDILSNEACALAGGLGLGGSLNTSDSHAMAQAIHGSATDIAGKNIANPSSIIFSISMLLMWLGEKKKSPDLINASEILKTTIEWALSKPETRTKDLLGQLTTTDMTKTLLEHLK